MNRLLPALALLVVLVACLSPDASAQDDPFNRPVCCALPPPPPDSLTVLQRYLDALAAEDWIAVASLTHPDELDEVGWYLKSAFAERGDLTTEGLSNRALYAWMLERVTASAAWRDTSVAHSYHIRLLTLAPVHADTAYAVVQHRWTIAEDDRQRPGASLDGRPMQTTVTYPVTRYRLRWYISIPDAMRTALAAFVSR